MKKSVLLKTIVIVILFLLTLSALSASRVVSTQTLTIYGSIPERTSVSLDANGLPVLTSNSFNADVATTAVASDSYLFEITAL